MGPESGASASVSAHPLPLTASDLAVGVAAEVEGMKRILAEQEAELAGILGAAVAPV